MYILLEWNLRTPLDNEQQLECRAANITRELRSCNVEIAALSETRTSGSSMDKSTVNDHGAPIRWTDGHLDACLRYYYDCVK